MKKILFLLVTVNALVLLSGAVLAGGPGCDSMKGHSKELSAESIKQFQSDHAWMFSEDGSHSDNKMKSQEENGKDQELKKASANMIEI